MEAVLKRKHPPKVQIMRVAISVRARSQNAVHAPYAQQLASERRRLCSNDRRLRPEKDKPETIISCNITQLDSAEKWEMHKSQERRKTGPIVGSDAQDGIRPQRIETSCLPPSSTTTATLWVGATLKLGCRSSEI